MRYLVIPNADAEEGNVRSAAEVFAKFRENH